MRVKIKSTDPEFAPITLTLTIESAEELAELAARLSLAQGVILADRFSNYKLGQFSQTYKLWSALHHLADQRGLVKP